MKRILFFATVLIIMISFSCDMMFDFNLFQELDLVPSASKQLDEIDNLTGEERETAIDELIDDLDSETFVENLTDDERAEIIGLVDDRFSSFTDGSQTPEQMLEDEESLYRAQEAAIIVAELELGQEGSAVIDNVNETLGAMVEELNNGSTSEEPDLSSIISGLYPVDATTEDIADSLLDLANASQTYSDIGEYLLPQDENGEAVVSPDVKMGDVATTGAVSIVVADMITNAGSAETVAAAIESGNDELLNSFLSPGISDDGTPLGNLLDASLLGSFL